MDPTAFLLPCGKRLHLQHGPIDLIIGADGDQHAAFKAATARFQTILVDLVAELPELRLPLTQDIPAPFGSTARRMDQAARPFMQTAYVTRMAAVAGCVADTVLDVMKEQDITRGYVNNGGDIALHLTPDTSFTMAMAASHGQELGRIKIDYTDPIRGIATSGRHGRSHSLGIADSVTVLAQNAGAADVAATLIANAVDLPNHPAVIRTPAFALDDTSDLGSLPVVTAVGKLAPVDVTYALETGLKRANSFITRNLISGAAIFLQDRSETTCPAQLSITQRTPHHA
ncbi:MAG: UPF0280 family protein [Roseobacter sp.]